MSLKNILNNIPNLDVDKIVTEVVNDPFLKPFFIKNDISLDQIKSNITKLYIFKNEITQCSECKGINNCTLSLRGLRPEVTYVDGQFEFSQTECNYKIEENASLIESSLLDAYHIPKKVLSASLDNVNFKLGKNKQIVYNKTISFLTSLRNGGTPKGFYLHGMYGKGKTYMLSALANECKKLGKSVVFCYYPDVVREIKSSIQTGNVESIIRKLKVADILILDDLGGETNTKYIRNEVLGSVLQFRLNDDKPTFFSSNLKIKSLGNHFKVDDSKEETANAMRIIKRIIDLTENNEIEL